MFRVLLAQAKSNSVSLNSTNFTPLFILYPKLKVESPPPHSCKTAGRQSMYIFSWIHGRSRCTQLLIQAIGYFLSHVFLCYMYVQILWEGCHEPWIFLCWKQSEWLDKSLEKAKTCVVEKICKCSLQLQYLWRASRSWTWPTQSDINTGKCTCNLQY